MWSKGIIDLEVAEKESEGTVSIADHPVPRQAGCPNRVLEKDKKIVVKFVLVKYSWNTEIWQCCTDDGDGDDEVPHDVCGIPKGSSLIGC
eukprot:7718553-Lingulodinium_polyedra.AAC.1